jgi:hypothetical protein
MPRKPSSSGFALSIDADFDETRNYRVKLIELEETQAVYAGAKPGEMAMIWHVAIYREDGTAFLDTRTDEVWDQWIWSSDSMFKTAKGRGYLEAFMGREMEDEDVDVLIDSGFRESVMGRTALASFEIKTTADGNEQLRVVLLRPDKSKSRAEGAASPAPAVSRSAPPPEQLQETVAAAAPTPISQATAAPRRRPRIDD